MAASTVVLDSAPPDYPDARPIDPATLGTVLADQTLPDGRHIVLADEQGPHRLWLRDPRPGQRLAFVIVHDERAALRHAVAQRFERRLDGLPGGPLPPACRPTTFQRRRLTLLLNLLEARLARASAREIARLLVYPWMAPLRGADWKGSAERRRTQRLIDEAVALMTGGYRALLARA